MVDLKALRNDSIIKIEKALDALDKDLSTLRVGRASPSILDSVKVDYFGSMVPITQVGTITTPEPRMIMVNVWDKAHIIAVEAALRSSNLGMSPVVDGNKIKLIVPVLTEDRRKELVKKSHEYAEKSKISLRHIRKSYFDELKVLQKNKEITEDEYKLESDSFEKSLKSFNDKVDTTIEKKSKEIMTI